MTVRRSDACRLLLGVALAAGVLGGAVLRAQPAGMPDAREMSGVPLPSGDLPVGSVVVRLVREGFRENLSDVEVRLVAGGEERTARTGADGRATFEGLLSGTEVQASAVVDGERLESERFSVPSAGGVRLMLVALAGAGAEAAAPTSVVPAQPGSVVLGGESRIVVELADEGLEVYNLFEISNTGRVPVTTASPLVFEMPQDAQAASLLEGSTPQATVADGRVAVTGPFQPGRTSLEYAYRLPYAGDSLVLRQTMPAALEQASVVVRQLGSVQVASSQLGAPRTIPVEDRTYLLANGPGLPAGGTLEATLTGLPHHAQWPRMLALASAALIVLGGLWFGVSGATEREAKTRHRHELLARRERLLSELVAVEHRRRTGGGRRGDDSRREELVRRLERVYAGLDELGDVEDRRPEPAASSISSAKAPAQG